MMIRHQTSDIRHQEGQNTVCLKSGVWSLKSDWGQAALEMTLALFCALLLMFGAMKVCIWVATRLVTRQQNYEATREPSSDNSDSNWSDDDQASRIPLEIFK